MNRRGWDAGCTTSRRATAASRTAARRARSPTCWRDWSGGGGGPPQRPTRGPGAMLGIMKRQAYVSKIPRLLPPETPVANKTGEITAVSHDVGLIYAPSGPIALSVLTEGARDRVAAEDAIGRIARAVYDAWS